MSAKLDKHIVELESARINDLMHPADGSAGITLADAIRRVNMEMKAYCILALSGICKKKKADILAKADLSEITGMASKIANGHKIDCDCEECTLGAE